MTNKLTAFGLFLAFNTFANIPQYCIEEITTLLKESGFDEQKFRSNLPVAVAKAKLMAKDFNKPKDNAKTNIGMTFGCVRVLPESPREIAFLLKNISLKAATAQEQPQYVQPQEQLQYAQPPTQEQSPPQAQPQYVQPQPQYVYPPPSQVQPQYIYLPQQGQCLCPQQQGSAQPQFANMEKRRKIQRLIDDGLEKNKEQIEMESVYLSLDEREALYEKNKKGAIGSAILNGSIGLGIGSYIQGNIGFGIAQTLIDGLGFILISADIPEGGTVTMAINRIAGFITSFVYQSSYNKTLDSALGSDAFSYSIDPLIVPKDGAPAVGLAFNIRY